MGDYRVYWIYDPTTKQAYVGKGPDGRIERRHSASYEKLIRRPAVMQYETYPFSGEKDALIAEAVLITVVDMLPGIRLLNKQKRHFERCGPRYPFDLAQKKVGEKALARAIVVTIKPDRIDRRIAWRGSPTSVVWWRAPRPKRRIGRSNNPSLNHVFQTVSALPRNYLIC